MLKQIFRPRRNGTYSDTYRKMEIRSDAIIKTLEWEEIPAHAVSGSKLHHITKLRKKVSASVQVISVESLTYNSSAVRGYVSAELNTKNVRTEGGAGALKQLILADNNAKKI